jgi:hypothetical protein
MSELTAEDLESMDNADVDWVETVRALQAENKRLTADLTSARADADAWRRSTKAVQAERDAAVAQAQASAEEARVLRGAARPFADGLMDDGRYQRGASGFFFEVASPEEAQALKAALATPQSAYAKLAEARKEVVEAERAAVARKNAAWAALADAETGVDAQ